MTVQLLLQFFYHGCNHCCSPLTNVAFLYFREESLKYGANPLPCCQTYVTMVATVNQISVPLIRNLRMVAPILTFHCMSAKRFSPCYTFQDYTRNGVDHSVPIQISLSKFEEGVPPCSCFNGTLRNGSHHPPPKIS